jgi:probable rRNA maturation factor
MITYSSADVVSPRIGQTLVSSWLKRVVIAEGKLLGDISIVFCTDEFLLVINKDFLHHDFYTDIITFDYCESNLVNGELYISLDRVKENATTLCKEYKNELLRVMVHGVLHLCGYKDKSAKDEKLMRSKEDFYLAKI